MGKITFQSALGGTVDLVGPATASTISLNLPATSGDIVGTGGALGTPSSGTVTNLTGTASININGTVGATTPTTVVATTVKASTTMGVGAATPSASGAGITFPATQSASTNVNTLDDYEEGTFTATIVGTTTAGVGTYNSQVGVYTKVGRAVSFNLIVNWTAHTGTGNMNISGLPFTSAASGAFSCAVGYVSNVALTAGNILTAWIDVSAVQVRLQQTPSGGGAVSTVPIDTAAIIFIAGTYFTA